MNEPPNPEVAVFAEALELPADQRGAFLDQACAGNAELRRQVEALLRVHDDAGNFFDRLAPTAQPASGAGAMHGLGDTMRVFATPAGKLGDRIGRYKLLQQIGEGGCGVVYMAEQEEPVRRKVALKVIKLGMDTKSVIARFEAERQALALMDHPNIAKVLDAGATETGRPYFVMELVRGVKITDYCDQNDLSTQERLTLFVQVCQAIQHAHQKGIIHRDIKPSNILVTVNDGVPLPKIIDFGIAKATAGRLTDRTLFTAFEQFLGTPAYMSPEQTAMSSVDIDTRSDIYSLGVLLYELLTGQTPFDSKMLLQAGLEEIRRTIREKEPARPSTRLSTMAGADLTVIARTRDVAPPKLIHLVRGDLDWIVMKALEKDRTRRYETVNGLAMDVQRHLGNEPVVARPPSNLYKLQKLVRRNRFSFVAAAFMLAVLLAATGISAWQAIRASRAENLAKQRLADSQASEVLAKERLADSEVISKFLTEVFQSPDPARDGRSITVAETLSNAAIRLETDLAGQPARRANLQATLGLTYFALGLYREAIPLQEKVRDYWLAASGLEHPDTLNAMHNLANSYHEEGGWAEALKLREQVLTSRRKLLGPEHPDTLSAMYNLAISYDAARREDEALNLREQVLALRRKALGPQHPDTLTAMNDLAISYSDHRRAEALKLREQVLTLRRKALGPQHPDTLLAMHNLALSYSSLHSNDEALTLLEQVLVFRRKISGSEHPDTLWAMNDLAISYGSVGRYDDAANLLEQLLALRRKVSGPKHFDTLRAMNDLTYACGSIGRSNEVITLLKQECEVDPVNVPALATWQTWFGRDAEYEATRRSMLQQFDGTDLAPTADRVAKAACLRPFRDAAQLAQALKLARRAVELGKNDPWLPWYQLSLGMAEYRNGQYAAAERTLASAVQTAPEQHDILGTAGLHLAMSVFRQDRPEEARKLFAQAAAQMPPFPEDERKPRADGRPLDQNVLILWLAYKEAKTLIDAPSAPTPEPSPPKQGPLQP